MTEATICIHYAYPSSPMAARLDRGEKGAWYYTLAHPDDHPSAAPRGVTGSYEDTARLCSPPFFNLPKDRYCMSRFRAA